MNPAGAPEPPTPTWRTPSRLFGSTQAAGGPSNRWVATFWTLLLIVGLIVLVYVSWPPSPGAMRWAVLPIDAPVDSASDRSLAKSYFERIRTALGESGGNQCANLAGFMASVSEAVEGRQRIQEFISDPSLTDKDTLVLYVAARGFVRAGEARLEFSDFDVEDVMGRSFSLEELLHHFRSCPAKNQLLILDVNAVNFDPRIGVLFNDFPSRVAEAVQGEGEKLWVLVSHCDFQTQGEYLSRRPSLLCDLIVRALRGEAKLGDDDGYLRLGDLYKYVCRQSTSLFADAPSAGETPLLLHGGSRHVVDDFNAIPKDLRIAKISPIDGGAEEGDQKNQGGSKAAARAKSKINTKAGSTKSQIRGKTRSKVRNMIKKPRISHLFSPGLSVFQSATDDRGSDAGKARGHVSNETPENNKVKAAPPTASRAGMKSTAKMSPAAPETKPDRSPAKSAAPDAQKQPTSRESADQTPVGRMNKALDDLWAARDALESPDRDFWAPVDVCPIDWRDLHRKLLYLAKQWRMGTPPASVTPRARRIAADLILLKSFYRKRKYDKSRTFKSELRNELDYIASQCPPTSVSALLPGAVRRQRDRSIRLYNQSAFFLPCFVHWVAVAPITPEADGDSLFDKHAKRLRDIIGALRDLRQTLTGLDGKTLIASDALRLPSDKLQRRIVAFQNAIAETVDRVGAPTTVHNLAAEKQVCRLLDSPLLRADQRRQLRTRWQAWQATAPIATHEVAEVSPPLPDSEIPGLRRKMIDQLVEIQRALVELFAPGESDVLDKLSQSLETVRDEEDAAARNTYRTIATTLSDFYASLPDDINQSVTLAPEPAALDHASTGAERRRMLGFVRLVDLRDRQQLKNKHPSIWQQFVIKIKPPVPELELVGPPRVSLPVQVRTSKQVAVGFKASAVPGEITATVQFDPNAVKITRRGGESCKNGVPFGVTKSDSAQLQLAVRASRPRRSDTEKPSIVTVVFAAGSVGNIKVNRVNCRIECTLPGPDRIELIARKRGLARQERLRGTDLVRLRSFPNRATHYDFYLANLGDEDKTVAVQLFKIPEIGGRTWAPGRLRSPDDRLAEEILRTVFAGGRPDAGIEASFLTNHLLAEIAAVPLQAGGEERLSFAKDTGGAAAAKPNAADNPTTPSVSRTSKKSVGQDISYGLLCWITDKDEPEKHWAKWIELAVLPPSTYVTVQHPEYRNNELVVEAALRKTPGLFSADDTPVQIGWANGPPVELSSKTPTITLVKPNASASPVGEPIYLTVDGYPRAFALRDPRRPGDVPGGEIVTSGNLAGIWIKAVTARSTGPDSPGATPPPDVRRMIEKPKAVTAFKECSDLLVELAADVPTFVFDGTYKASEAIRVTVNGRPLGNPWYADRKVSTSLISLEDGIVLHTAVADHVVRIQTAGARNIKVEATLPKIQGKEIDPARLIVHVDGIPPVVTSAHDAYTVTPGDILRAELTIRDEGGAGVERVLYAVVPDPGKLQETDMEEKKFGELEIRDHTILRIDTRKANVKMGQMYTLVVIAYDRAGNRSETRWPVETGPPAPTRPLGDIQGTAAHVQRVGWKLKISGPGYATRTLSLGDSTRDAGFKTVNTNQSRFWFKDLKPGTYTITIQGFIGGRSVKSAPIEVVVKPGEESTPAEITEFKPS